MVHITAQNNSDNLPSYPPDNHHSSDIKGRGQAAGKIHTCTNLTAILLSEPALVRGQGAGEN